MKLSGFFKADQSQKYIFTVATDVKFSYRIDDKVYTNSTLTIPLEEGFHFISLSLETNGNMRFYSFQVGTDASKMGPMEVYQTIDGSQIVSKYIGVSQRNAFKHEISYNFKENLIIGKPNGRMCPMRGKKFKECLRECNI